jgi:hypothetical protein
VKFNGLQDPEFTTVSAVLRRMIIKRENLERVRSNWCNWDTERGRSLQHTSTSDDVAAVPTEADRGM